MSLAHLQAVDGQGCGGLPRAVRSSMGACSSEGSRRQCDAVFEAQADG